MDNGKELAFPLPALTKREYFAAMAMQGLCYKENVRDHTTAETCRIHIARQSILLADELLKQLDGKEKAK